MRAGRSHRVTGADAGGGVSGEGTTETTSGTPTEAPATTSKRAFLMRAATLVAVATLLSRFAGFIREMVMANFFGTGMAADAFRGANQIPNFLRLLLGEAAIGAALIPVFTGYLTRGKKDDANRVASGAVNAIVLLLAVICGLGILFAPFVVSVTMPGFVADAAKFQLTVQLTRVMFPSVLFMALAGLLMGILNAHDRFTAAALAPVAMNIAWIGMVVVFAPSWGAFAPAWGFLVGSFVQFAVQLPALRGTGYRYDLGLHLDHPGVRRIFALIVPMVLSLATQDINSIVDSRFASTLGDGPVAAFGYAVRLWIFPVSIFAISVATVVFPTMSRFAESKDLDNLRKSIGQGMRVIMLLLVPSTVGLMVLAIPIVKLVFQRGSFTDQSTILTASALFFYALGLTTAGFLHIVNRAFYSLKDTRTPLIVALVSIVVNYVGDWVLMRAIPWFSTTVLGLPVSSHYALPLGGIALSTSLVSLTSFVALLELLRRRIGGVEGRQFTAAGAKIVASAAVLGVVAWWVQGAVAAALGPAAASTLGRLASVGAAIAAGAAVYAGMVALLKVEESRVAWDIVQRKLRRPAEPEPEPER